MEKKILIFILLLTIGSAVINMPPTVTWQDWTFHRPQLPGRDLEIKRGLDLAGGTRIVFQADMANISPEERNNALESLKSVIERRVNLFGVSEPVVQTSRTANDYRLIVELAGITDVDQALNLIGKTAELSFRETLASGPPGLDATIAAQLVKPFALVTNLSGRDLQKAVASFDPRTGEPVVQLSFTNEGAKKFAEITKRNLNQRIAIFLDNEILMAPEVKTVITDGRAVISGQFTPAQAKELAIQLNAGALPAPIRVLSQKTIPPNLGEDSVNKSLFAGVVGLGTVALFMLANYGKLGLFANISLVIYALMVLAIFRLVPVTLTLAGIAGFILSIGMAVDANILIFERVREEIQWGRNKLAALELGFVRAFPSIRDSNVSSLITCAILFWFGTGPVRGFSVTLAIGILVSLFTSFVVTRTFLRLAAKYV